MIGAGQMRALAARLVGRFRLTLLNDAGPVQRVQGEGLKGEVLEGLERMMDYGLSSRPLPGAEGLIVSVAGSRGNGVVLALGDRRYRMALEEGEVALHDDLGQVVHLTREGIRIASSLRVEIEAPEISLSAGTEMTLASPKIVLASEDLRLGGEGATVAVARHDDAVVAGKVVATSTTVKST
jgi:phage baseplate assembly protein V